MNDSNNICLACGLCCDGTVLGFVQLEREEVPALKGLLDIENDEGEGVFLQPCSQFCDGCSIYSQRPKQCASFKCGLLKSVEQKSVSFDRAVEVTDEVKLLKTAIEKKLANLQIELKSKSFYFQMLELSRWFQKNEREISLSKSYLDLKSDLQEFDNLLSKEMGIPMF
jgi:uncharacterized protein